MEKCFSMNKISLLLAVILLLPLQAKATPATLSIEDFNIKAGETKELIIDMTNPDDQITLVQFELRLPDGLSIAMEDGDFAIDIAGRTTWKKHSLNANALNGITRFLLASNTNAVISGTEGAIISVKLVAADNFSGGVIRLENILLVTPQQKESKLDVYIYNVTVISEPTGTATLSIEDFTIKAGETKEMVIDMTNPDDQISLVQFDMRLPAGLSIAIEDEDYAIDIAGRTTWKKHSLSANALDGSFRFLLASNTNAVISGTEGAVISVKLVAADNFSGGDIRLENILLVTPQQKESKPDTYTYTVAAGSVDVKARLDDNCKTRTYWYTKDGEGWGTENIHIGPVIPMRDQNDIMEWNAIILNYFMNGLLKLDVTGASADDVTPYLSFASEGNLEASEDGRFLYYIGNGNRQLVATLDPVTGQLDLQQTELVMSMLNAYPSDEYDKALALPLCVKATYQGEEISVENGSFRVLCLRPIDAVGVEDMYRELWYGKKMDMDMIDLVSLNDWRGAGPYSFKKGANPDLYKYYNVKSIKIKGATEDNLSEVFPSDIWGAIVDFSYHPLERESFDDIGTYGTFSITLKSKVVTNGTALALKVPIVVEYEWGSVETVTSLTLYPYIIVDGDANNDGTVNAADIVEVVNYIMGNPSEKFYEAFADANGDGVVNAADIVAIVNIIMGN